MRINISDLKVGDFLIYSEDNIPLLIEKIINISIAYISVETTKIIGNKYHKLLGERFIIDKSNYKEYYRPMTPLEKIKYL